MLILFGRAAAPVTLAFRSVNVQLEVFFIECQNSSSDHDLNFPYFLGLLHILLLSWYIEGKLEVLVSKRTQKAFFEKIQIVNHFLRREDVGFPTPHILWLQPWTGCEGIALRSGS